MDNKKLGIIYMIIASVSFAMMSVMVKLSGGRIQLFQQVFFRNLIMLIFAIVTIRKSNISLKVEKSDRLTLFLRCLLGFLGVLCVFYANNHMPLANAQAIQKLNPFFVIIFAAVILDERLTLRKILTVLAGFIGALIIINPGRNFDLIASVISIFSAVFGGFAYLMIRKLKGRVAGMSIIFYFSLFSFLVAFPLMLRVYTSPTHKEWLFLLLIGVFAAMGQYYITKAYLNAKASEVTLFDYSGVIASPLLGLLIFNEAISLRVIVGMIIIIIAGFIASRDKK